MSVQRVATLLRTHIRAIGSTLPGGQRHIPPQAGQQLVSPFISGNEGHLIPHRITGVPEDGNGSLMFPNQSGLILFSSFTTAPTQCGRHYIKIAPLLCQIHPNHTTQVQTCGFVSNEPSDITLVQEGPDSMIMLEQYVCSRITQPASLSGSCTSRDSTPAAEKGLPPKPQ